MDTAMTMDKMIRYKITAIFFGFKGTLPSGNVSPDSYRD